MNLRSSFLRHRRVLLASVVVCVGIITVFSLFTGNFIKARAANESVKVWLTTSDLSSKLSSQPDLQFSSTNGSADTTVSIDETNIRQTVDGFGASMTDASAYLIWNSPNKDDIMTRLFSPTDGIGISFLRQPIGASDFIAAPNTSDYYTYDDNGGNPDPDLTGFTIAKDTAYVLPLVSKAINLNSKVKVMGTPWSPPAWMKTGNNLIGSGGGTLKTEYYAAYANYFVKYLQAYQQQGIPIYAITPQNEPGTSPDYPSMIFSASDETNFIKNNLGPAIANATLDTKPKILAYDHNWDNTDYIKTVYGDADAKSYVAGSAWHHYAGDPSAMSTIHDLYPDKDIYETEGSPVCASGPRPATTFLRSMNNWSRTGVAWNIALRPDGGPWSTQGLGTDCTALVQIDLTNNTVNYTLDYYQIGHFSKFIVPGAVVIGGQGSGSIDAASFENPDGSKVVVAHNTDTSNSKTLQVSWNGQSFTSTLPADAIATFTWSGAQSNVINATSYSDQSGTQNETCTDVGGGQDVGYIDNGDYLGYQNVDFGTGVNTVRLRFATLTTATNDQVEFHLDSTTGPLVGTLTLQPTGGWQNWTTQTTSISGASGTHSIYLVFKGGISIGNVHWISFLNT